MYPCTLFPGKCTYTTDRKRDLEKHEAICTEKMNRKKTYKDYDYSSLDDILSLHGIQDKFDFDDKRILEEKYQIQFQFYKLCTEKQTIVGRRSAFVPGYSLILNPQQIINIG